MAKIVSRGDPIEPVYLNNLKVAAHGWGVVSGLAVSEKGAGANMSVDVAAGVAWINELSVVKGAVTNVVITAAHASYDRYDLVVINSSGTISVIAGTAAATSYANDYDLETNNAILLAEVYVPATDTTIEDAQITDKQIISYMEETGDLIYSIGLEEYSNHLGSTDNFTQTATSGNGTATADTTNHEMDLSSGITIVGYAYFETKKSWTLGTKPIVVNMIVDNFAGGSGGTRIVLIGLKNDFAGSSNLEFIGFVSSGVGWEAYTRGGSTSTATIVSVSDGDLLTIVATSSCVQFYINGTLSATHTSNISSSSLNMGSAARAVTSGATTACSMSLDLMDIKAYH